jgi:hypothetical protein
MSSRDENVTIIDVKSACALDSNCIQLCSTKNYKSISKGSILAMMVRQPGNLSIVVIV